MKIGAVELIKMRATRAYWRVVLRVGSSLSAVLARSFSSLRCCFSSFVFYNVETALL